MNACNSATSTSPQIEANIALTLLQQGLPVVVGMSYLLMADAARIFVSAFYRYFLEEGLGVAAAMSRSRHAIAQDCKRRASLNQTVDLQDWIVPVLYTQSPSFGSSWSLTQPLLEQQHSLSTILSNVFGASTISGREFDLYRVESLLAIHQNVELVGDYGVGLSEFLRYAMEFWQKTHFFETILLQTTSTQPEPYVIAIPGARKSPKALFMLDDIVNDDTLLEGVPDTSTKADHATDQLLEKVQSMFSTVSYLETTHCPHFPQRAGRSVIVDYACHV